MTEIWNELESMSNELLTVTVIKYTPISSILVGAIAIFNLCGSVRIPAGRLTADPPANELVAVIIRGFTSSFTKNEERS